MSKECKPNQIRNPLTGRCIKKDGRTAKSLSKVRSKKIKSPKRRVKSPKSVKQSVPELTNEDFNILMKEVEGGKNDKFFTLSSIKTLNTMVIKLIKCNIKDFKSNGKIIIRKTINNKDISIIFNAISKELTPIIEHYTKNVILDKKSLKTLVAIVEQSLYIILEEASLILDNIKKVKINSSVLKESIYFSRQFSGSSDHQICSN